MIKKSDSKGLSLATASILGQAPRRLVQSDILIRTGLLRPFFLLLAFGIKIHHQIL